MSALFPKADYAEDQRLAKTILTSHVVYRGFQSGAAVGLVIGGTSAAIARMRSQPKASVEASKAVKQLVARSTRAAIERRIGGSAFFTAIAFVFITPLYMRGQTMIQWQDRSWRLLHNDGQVEVDWWSLAGTAGGLATFIPALSGSASGVSPITWRTVLGRAGIGNLVGVVGYMGWRYGVMGKKMQ